ncbi:MAG: hypothetical protein JNK58_07435 [Phycisphaerae bacterium]|nr:hypothetical protein [Phycisphaerae bacterium]
MKLFERLASAALAASIMLPSALAQDKPCEQRVKELEEQLRQTENRLKDMVRENERLRKENAEAKPGGKDTKPTRNPTPAEPLSSPHSLFEALVKDFEAKVASLPNESKPDQVKFAGAAKRWAADATRDFRGPVEWTIQVVKVDPGASAKPTDVTFTILDKLGKPTGDPVTQVIPARFIKELSEGVGKKTFKLTGTFGAKPVHNAQRAEKGAKDEPRFIGPYTEFGYDLAVQNIVEQK